MRLPLFFSWFPAAIYLSFHGCQAAGVSVVKCHQQDAGAPAETSLEKCIELDRIVYVSTDTISVGWSVLTSVY